MTEPEQYLPDGVSGACWRRSERRRFDTAPRQLREVVALHVLSGTMRYMIEDRILSVGPRTLLWAFCDQSHILLSETPDFDMWVLVLARETLEPAGLCPPVYAADTGLETAAFILSPDMHAVLSQTAQGIRDDERADWLRTGLRWWTMRAWAACRNAPIASSTRTHPAVQRAVEAIEIDPGAELTEIASRAHLSLSRLGRLFRSEIGQTLGGYRTACRLQRVDRLMTGPEPPSLLVAALDAGLGSYPQFFRSFRAARGMQPRDYYRRSTGGPGSAKP